MKTAVIIEDEPFAQDELKRLLKANAELKILATLETVKQSLEWFETHPEPDIVFLDVQLADGISFEIFDSLKLKAPVIFTTAYDEYAIKAFRLNSIDYLLKPIEENELIRALKKLDQHSSQTRPSWEELSELLGDGNKKEYRRRFLSKRGDRMIRVNAEDAVLLQADDDIVWLFDKEEKKYILDSSLEQLSEELDPEEFFRISRSQIVNMDYISQVHKYFNGRLKLEMSIPLEKEVIVTRSNYRDFLKHFGQ